VVGGHSIRDEETKFGYSVTGLVNPQRVLKNGGARPGDRLLLTKALGTGVISTAIKNGVAKHSWIDAAVASMTTLNKTASEVITGDRIRNGRVGMGALARSTGQSSATDSLPDAAELRSAWTGEAPVSTPATPFRSSVHALTDITGFGLIGHLREMLLASENVSAKIYASSVPLLEGALDCVRAGLIPGGLKANREFAECAVEYETGISEEIKTMLFDPQTAGGLLISVASEHSDDLRSALNDAGVSAVAIGEVLPRSKPLIVVA
jgi:selenide,water dikinase